MYCKLNAVCILVIFSTSFTITLSVYPVFENFPEIKNVTTNSIEIAFREWDEITDFGEGTQLYYIIEYMEDSMGHRRWLNSKSIRANSSTDKVYSATINNLLIDTVYAIRVIIEDISGNTAIKNTPVIYTRTLCGVPEEPPMNIAVDTSQSTVIAVTWKLPPENTWNCKDVAVDIYLNSSNSAISPNYIKYKDFFLIKTNPYTEWNVALRIVSTYNDTSRWSPLTSVISAQDAPSQVTNLLVNKVTANQIYITWDKPEKENGIITKYIVQYYQLNWLHNCNLINTTSNTKEVDANQTFLYIDAYPNSIYSISVTAETVKRGPEVVIESQTEESIPDGPPQNARLDYNSAEEAFLLWEDPECNLANGRITQYRYIMKSPDFWENRTIDEIIRITEVQFYDLIPFTQYIVQIYAGTNVGFSNHSAQVTFRTKSSKPPAPSDLTVYQRSESILSLSWIPPFPPKGMLLMYKIRYSCNICELKEKEVFINETSCAGTIKEDRHCYSLSGLQEFQKYEIQIQAYNSHIGEAGEATSISSYTRENVPDSSENSDVENITEHSSIATLSASVRVNRKFRDHKINVTSTEPSISKITESAKSITTDSATKIYVFSSLQTEPIINYDYKIFGITDTTADIFIKSPYFNGDTIYSYFIIVRKSGRSDYSIGEFIPKWILLSYNESRALRLDEYAAAKFLPKEINSTGIKFTVGDGKNYNGYYNAPLVTGEKYKFGVAVLGDFNEKERIAYNYFIDPFTVENSKNFKGSSSIFFIIALVVAITILIAFVDLI